MSIKSTKVVLLGRKTEGGETLTNLVGSIFPTEVPVEFIYSVNLIFDKGPTVEIPGEEIDYPIELAEPNALLDYMDIQKNLKVLEIIIDLDAVSNKLNTTTTSILDKFIDNSD